MTTEANWAVLNVRLSHVVPMIVASATIGFATPAVAAGTAAGTPIANTATATYTDPGNQTITVNSNTVTLRVDEILDVTVAPVGGAVTVTPGATDRPVAFTVTNQGNGPEAFLLTPVSAIGGDQFDPTDANLFIDNTAPGQGTIGVYDPGIDTPYTLGTPTDPINPDASITVFIVSDIPAGQTDTDRGDIRLTAAASTGTGAPGTAFAGQGQNGGDAVVGASGASASGTNSYIVQGATVAFVKSASIVDPFGGSRPLPGAIITYTLVATTSGSGTLTNLRISDIVPATTTYQAGTITLEGAALTDPADADAGEYDTPTTTVTVRLGNVSGGQTRTVTFRTRIN